MGGNFHLHLPHKKQQHQQQQQQQQKGGGINVPKGCLAIKVGPTEEEQERIVVPVSYLNHPLFMKLLKEAEDEYGFHHQGTITIPCHVEEFRYVQALIDQDHHHHHHHHQHHHHHHQHHHHHHNPIVGCFRA